MPRLVIRTSSTRARRLSRSTWTRMELRGPSSRIVHGSTFTFQFPGCHFRGKKKEDCFATFRRCSLRPDYRKLHEWYPLALCVFGSLLAARKSNFQGARVAWPWAAGRGHQQGGHRVVHPKSIAVFGKVPNSTPHISITIGCTTQNSSDLSLGRRPDSKSDEF